MGAATRINAVLRANIHETIYRTETPAQLMQFQILEIQESIEQTRGEIATAEVAERRLAQLVEETEEAAQQWDRQARRSMERNDDTMVREALRLQSAALAWAAQYRQVQREQAEVVSELQSMLEYLQVRLQQATTRQASLTDTFTSLTAEFGVPYLPIDLQVLEERCNVR